MENHVITLRLQGHCIQTAIRCRYEKMIKSYFKTGKTADKQERYHLECTVEILRHLLEKLDFGKLRERYPVLRGEEDAEIELHISPEIDPEGEIVNLKLRIKWGDLTICPDLIIGSDQVMGQEVMDPDRN